MTGFKRVAAFTLRERRAVAVPLALWGLVTVVAALTGPFQTYTALPALQRTLYWAVVAGLSVGLSTAFLRAMAGRGARWRLAGWLPFALILAALVLGLNRVVFGGWAGWSDYGWLVAVVLVVCLVVEGMVLLFRSAPGVAVVAGTSEAAEDPVAGLMERLPLERRGRLIRIEAQDHYLSVVTGQGAALILMRLSDAEALLRGAEGLRVHRSHWVMRAEVRAHRRRDGRDLLLMSDGAEVPVSRSAREAARAAGLIVGRQPS